jgi:carbohydrate kinase (thermoresistant glucokinase family)
VIVVICGVAGVGKTTVGRLLAKKLEWQFYEADDLHSAENISKMSHGIPLTDEDRGPWLERLRQLIEHCTEINAVLACSALKKVYRDRLRVSEEVKFVFLHASRARVAEQLRRRRGHFMSAALLDSQFADLEEPKPEEHALIVDFAGPPGEVASLIKTKLSLQS